MVLIHHLGHQLHEADELMTVLFEPVYGLNGDSLKLVGFVLEGVIGVRILFFERGYQCCAPGLESFESYELVCSDFDALIDYDGDGRLSESAELERHYLLWWNGMRCAMLDVESVDLWTDWAAGLLE